MDRRRKNSSFAENEVVEVASALLAYLSLDTGLGNSQLEHALWVLKIPTTSVRNFSVSSALIVLRSFGVLGR